MNGSKPPAAILLMADDFIVRFGLQQIIATQPDLSIYAIADTIEAALQIVGTSTADLAIVDLAMGVMTDLELIGQLHTIDGSLPVLVFSMQDEPRFAERAFQAGARAYVMRGEGSEALIHAIREVLAGRTYGIRRGEL